MTEYPSNSLNAKEKKEERERPQPVAIAREGSKRKSELKKFASNFISDDAGNVESYLFKDVIVPSIKSAIQQLVTKGIDYILYGNAYNSSPSSQPKVSYRGAYVLGSSSRQDTSRDVSVHNNKMTLPCLYIDVNDYENRQKALDAANSVRDGLIDILEHYGYAKVSDYYDLMQLTCPYTYENYGWYAKDISSIPISENRKGYSLELPPAVVIKDN